MTPPDLLDAIRRIIDLLGPDRPGATLPRLLVDMLQALFPCDAAAVLRLEDDTLRPLAVAGLSHDTLGRRFRLQDHPRLLTLLQRRGATRLASDCQLPDPYDGLVEGRAGQLEVHDCMGCPLYQGDRPWGLLTLDALDPHSFESVDPAMLEAFAGLAGAALAAGERFGNLQQRAQREQQLVRALAERGRRGVAFDLPGLGLAERPADFDYSWTGLGRFAVQAVDALGLDDFHLVVHDIGGPVGFELAAALRGRVRSITLLNTLLAVSRFRKPWVMRPFEVPLLGEAWLASMVKPAFRLLMAWQGIGDVRAVPPSEIDAHVALLKHGDGGRAFLRIMRSFETTAEKEARYISTVRNVPYPVQLLWGAQDPALRLDVYGRIAADITGAPLHTVPGKHFLQEDQAPAIADAVARIASQGERQAG